MRAVCTSLLVLISLTACNNDDKNTGVGTNSTTANNPPTVAAVVLNPDPGFEFTLLNCQATGLDDLNGDVVSLAYKWEVNGTEIAVVAGTLNGDDFSKGDTVSCTVTPNDGLIDGTPVASSIVTILNTPPAGTSVEIGPDPSNLLDTLTATPLGWTDPDGDAESWNFDWYVNGSSVGAATNTLSNSFEKGDEVYAIATPNDLDDLGEPLQSNTLVIVNTPPTLANANITPSAPFAGDILVCAPSGESDLDGDPVSYLFEWFVSGNAAGSGTEILVAPSFTRGDDVYCIITPTDLEDEGTPVQSGTVTIFNAAPTIAAATLTPEPAYKSTILACSGSGIVDTDGDAPLLSFSWTVGGVPIAAADPALDGASFSRDDAVQCTIIVSDGVDASAPAVSNLVVIQNTPPTATSVAIGPSSPYTGDPVSAIVSGWDDLDLDLEGYQYTWYVNGIERIGEVGVSLPAANYVKHDLITVQATPDDGTDTGPPVLSDPVEILNSSPVLDSADITPANPLATDTLTCNVGASSDDDGDGVSNSYQWFVNGVPVGSGTNQLAAPDFGAGDNIYCVATPNDGEEDGAPVQSATVSADNTAPTIQMVTLAPNPGYEDDVLTCTASGINDNDGDTVTLSYEWLVGGLPIAANTPTIDGANFNKDQAVQCIVTGNDGSTDSAPINSNVVFILNTPPSALSADISPTDPTTIDNVGVTMSGWLDINGDTESYLYQWSVNGFALPGQTGTSLTSANYVKGDLISITATPNDGTDFGTPIVSSEVPVLNTPPTLASATVTPASPVASDILGCTPSGGADIDGDTVTYTYQWYVNSIPAGTGPTLAAPASGDTAYCEVTPNDGDDDGTPVASGWVSVDNTAPTIGSVTLSPDPAYETTTLTCTAANVDDVDGDLVTLAYSWTVGGVPILPVTTTLNGAYFNREQAVQCFVIASDSSSNSGAVNSNLVVIQNTAPAFTSVVISPTDPTTTDNVTAAASGWSDLDGDGESYTYQWYVNSVLESGATNVSLTSGNYVKGDFLTVRATPFDGTDSGGSLLSAPIEVQNTAPTTPGISISPNPPDESENLICSIDTNSTDADNDAVIYLYSWNLGGAVTSETSNTVPSSATTLGDLWECFVTADDGQDLSGTTSAAVVVTDTVAPDAPTLDELDAYDNDSVYDVTGNGEANATITLTAVCDGTSSGQLVTNADPSGNFIFNFLSDLGETCTFTAFAVDADGNASGDSNQVGTTICAVPDPYEGGGYGDTQADAIDEWFPLPDNGLASYSLQGNILDNDPGDWFVVHGTDDTVADNVAFNNNYDFRVQVTDTSAQYTFVVHKGNLGSTILECASLSTNGYDDYNDFIFDSGDGPDHVPPAVTTNCRDNNASYNNCDDMTKSYYIQVIRDPAFTFDCTNYEITVTNNAP